MKEIELINKRKPREKHFLQEDGTIIAKVYDSDIHYKKNGKYEEIDNTLINENGCYYNKANKYKAIFFENNDNLMKISKDDFYLNFKLKGIKTSKVKKREQLNKYISCLSYDELQDGISVEYKTLPGKVKETIILSKNNYKKLTFILNTNLELFEKDSAIIAKDEGNTVFVIEKPYMIDSKGEKNNNVIYKLKKHAKNYELELILDDEWLNLPTTKFPIYIDPTVSNDTNEIELYDTYIYPGDNNDNKNEREYLKAGVERINGVDKVNRALVKFTLPEIGTGSEIVSADLYIIPYLKESENEETRVYLMEAHQVTEDWNEETATWENMHDKFDSRVESISEFERSKLENFTLLYRTLAFNITNLAKKWYRDTPNYGIMIKSCDETYVDDDYPMIYSKNNDISGDPKPVAYITYKNLNGLEDYLEYKQHAFIDGVSYVNTYNGNVTNVFNVGSINGNLLPVDLNLIYNTHDVILERETFFGKGYRLNLEEEIEVQSDNQLLLIDADGTEQYFIKNESTITSEGESVQYYNEDNYGVLLTKNNENCTIEDLSGNKKTYTLANNKYKLSEVRDTDDNYYQIILNDNGSISNIIDKWENEISLSYSDNEVIISSPNALSKINKNNNLPISLERNCGVTQIIYNEKNIISEITDVTGIKIKYDYYDISPYKIKKVTQYGINNTQGFFYNLEYGNEQTIITDFKDRVEILTFNTNGNLISINNLKSINDISSAYSTEREYGYGNTNNRMISSTIPIKYIKNYLKNTSFENDNDFFVNEEGITKEYDTENYFSGLRSMKLQNEIANKSIEYNVDVQKGKYYTFSGYFKGDIKTSISLSYINENNEEITSKEQVRNFNEFNREDVTIYYDENATSLLKIRITLEEIGVIYIDDIQLEEGEVANYFNILENSDFSEGLSDWTLSAGGQDSNIDANNYMQIVNINENNDKALKINKSSLVSTGIRKKFDIKGKVGDLYTLSFWYKNDGVTQYAPHTGSSLTIFYEPYNEDNGHCIVEHTLPVTNEWQHYIHREKSIDDFKSITIAFSQYGDANEFYLTDLSFYKDVTHGEYNYDEQGNLLSIEDQSNNINAFNYDNNNKLISSVTPRGNNYKFEYDNVRKDRVISTISSSGISNRVEYDSNGNAIKTKIIKNISENIENGKYKIRAKGDNKYLKAELLAVFAENNQCSNTIWEIENIAQSEKYKIKYSVLPNYFLAYDNSLNITLSTDDENNEFYFEENNNGSFRIYALIDEETKKYLKLEDNLLKLDNLIIDNHEYEFYLENDDGIFIETNTTYSPDGRFVTSVTDSNFNTTQYETDENTGLLKSITNANGIKTDYIYNSNQGISRVSIGNMSADYEYNQGNMISRIGLGNKEYNYIYDEFYQPKEVFIGANVKLMENKYEDNNGELKKVIYGNGHTIEYDYNELEQIKTMKKMDDVYHYKYDNNGNIAKIISNNDYIKYKYDTAKRVYNYRNNNFDVYYTYDKNDNITNRKYIMDSHELEISANYNKDDMIISETYGDSTINYIYDDLNRITKKKLSDEYETEYKYVSHGKRTSTLIESINNNGEKIKYSYDKLNNIKEVYVDEILNFKYTYDIYNQLIKEENLLDQTYIEYNYDNYGNMLSKKTKHINTDELLSEHNYSYENNQWYDQVTKYDNNVIEYDAVGNIVKYGNTINMTWKNGNELKTYANNAQNINIEFKYNDDSLRTKKIINNKVIEYFYDNNKLVLEKNGTNILQFLRNDNDELVGLTYNGTKYYYISNIQDDIIGILNSNFEKVVTYEYDSWGNIINITDNTEEKIGTINPYRYRGYYYDEETNLYYLGTRYYNPELCRFISADSSTGEIGGNPLGHNMYQYAFNNPINCEDSGGNWPKWLKKAAKAVAVVAVVATVAAVTVATCGAGSVAATIAVGALKGAMIGMAIGAVGGAVSGVVENRVKTGSWKGSGTAALNGAADGAFWGAVSGTITGGVSKTVNVVSASQSWNQGTFSNKVSSMNYHYKKHVIQEEIKNKNVLQYTDDAIEFANRNKNVLKFDYRARFNDISWKYKYRSGMGGKYTSDGKILTFWYNKK